MAQRMTSGFFLYCSLLNLKLLDLATQTSQEVSGICLSLCNNPQQTCVIILCFCMGFGGANPGPHARVASFLLTEPAPQLLNLFKDFI